jgi:hypothetical protein
LAELVNQLTLPSVLFSKIKMDKVELKGCQHTFSDVSGNSPFSGVLLYFNEHSQDARSSRAQTQPFDISEVQYRGVRGG